MHKPISFVLWNLENLFNPETGGPRKDYTPERGWTWERFDQKLRRLERVFNAMPLENGIDLLGIVEVDDEKVIQRLIKKCLGLENYAYVTCSDMNTDNLDCALIYRKNRFSLKKFETITVLSRYPKGDILFATLEEKSSGEEFLISINHWASRLSGNAFSNSFRCTAAENLQSYLWRRAIENEELEAGAKNLNIIVAGDFNDDPYSPSMMEHLLATYDRQAVIEQDDENAVLLYNTVWKNLTQTPPGTLFYSGNRGSYWNLFDQIHLSKDLLCGKKWLYREDSFRIFTEEVADSTGRPLPCYYWDEEAGESRMRDGVSDHFPVYIILDYSARRKR
ncbi:hypothetical protein ACFL35_04030 [Candidatus Riflebacteria bacterium]